MVPGLILYRWDAPLFFANADLFREHVIDIVDHAPPPVRWLAVTSEPVTDIDTTAADMFDELITELARRGVELHFAEMKGHVKDRLRTYGLFDRLGPERFHPTVGRVVKDYLARHPDVAWRDWEDEPEPPTSTPSAPSSPSAPFAPSMPDPPPDQPPTGGGVRGGGPLRPPG